MKAQLKHKKAWLYSPVLKKNVELPFYSDGRRDEELRRVIWTLDGSTAYTMCHCWNRENKRIWHATRMNFSYASRASE
ncbi:MAG: hypothetical protein LUD83_03505 [Clostridiales bacterium]|nr:hypothetical protein [Clostridiales bacterium]